MKIKLSSKIINFLPGISYTIMVIHGCKNERKVSNVSQLLCGTAVVAKNDIKKADRTDRKAIFEKVTGFCDKNGETFLESYHLDSRIKKILAGKDIEGQNNLINFVAWFSLKYFLPLFGFDLDKAETDYLLTLYTPKKGKQAPALDFVPETRNLVLFFPNLGGWSDEEIDNFVGEINLNLGKYFNTGISAIYRLDSEHSIIDLGYQSELEREYLEKEAEKKQILDLNNSNSAPYRNGKLELPEKEMIFANTILEEWLRDYMTSKNESLKDIEKDVEVEIPREAEHGDLSTNLAMKLAKSIGKPSMEIAEEISNYIKNRNTEEKVNIFEKIETIAPGFVNFHLSNKYFQERLNELLSLKELYGRSRHGVGKKIMIEFGSLNIAKPFGAHHFLTTVIGQTLVNLYRLNGYEVLAGDYPGDWGTQFGKSIYAYKHWGDKDTVEKDPMNELLNLYVKFHEEAEKNPSLEDAARKEFKKLEAGDEENIKLWKWLVEISTKDLNEIYKTMGVHHDRIYPESKYNEACKDILEHGKELGIIKPGEKGAYIVNLDDKNLPPALVQKADGTTLYITRDIASISDRLKTENNLNCLIYVVDMAQTLHFKQLFAVAEKLHEADSSFPIAEFKHVPYGRMSFVDSSMSTRKGNIIRGRDILHEASIRAERVVKEKIAENGQNFSAAEINKLVHGIAIGAVKYAMLCQAPESDFVFDWERVISLEGNSAPYLQYSLARAYSITRRAVDQNSKIVKPAGAARSENPLTDTNDPNLKANTKVEFDANLNASVKKEGEEGKQISMFSLAEEQEKDIREREQAAAETGIEIFSLPEEKMLLRLLMQYPKKVAAAAENYKPNILTTYLHELAQTFNSFYGAVPVLKTQREDLRSARQDLVKATAQILKNGLQALGIATFDRM